MHRVIDFVIIFNAIKSCWTSCEFLNLVEMTQSQILASLCENNNLIIIFIFLFLTYAKNKFFTVNYFIKIFRTGNTKYKLPN